MRTRKLVPAVLLALTVGGCTCGGELVGLNENAERAWSDIDSTLQRRADLIPNLVEVAKGYAAHEKDVFANIANARAAMMGSTTRVDRMAANDQLSGALSRLVAVSESYPQLKADSNFSRLMDELSGTENRINTARKRYNEAAQSYNTEAHSITGSWWVRLRGLPNQKDYFKADASARAAPRVQFTK